MNVRACLLALAIAAATVSAHATEVPDDRRAHDSMSFWVLEDRVSNHNHFHVFVYGPARYPGPDQEYQDEATFIEVTATTIEDDGTTRARVFRSATQQGMFPGSGGFTEGPCLRCGPHDALFFALPSDFGGTQAVVDVRVWIPAADGDCGEAAFFAPCGGSVAGYVNPAFVGVPNPWNTDAGDALPWLTTLL